jgi:N-acetylneuraminate synthase
MNDVTLGSRLVGEHTRPYVIAEIGVNHGGSLDVAKQLIEYAKAGGCDAAKFQTYKAATLASRHSPAYWDTTKETSTSQFALFSRYDCFGEAEYRALADHCARVGIDFLSTPFDDAAVEFLDHLVPFFKVASADLTNIPLLRRIARKKKPVLLSTGASTLAEIDTAVTELRRSGCETLALLHCVLNYPTGNTDAHLAMIKGLSRAYPDLLIGYSDHTFPDQFMTALVTAFLVGARVLEKHFTYDKTLPGNDHYHAMDKDDARRLIAQLDSVCELLGPSEHKAPLPSETPARLYARRSIVVARSLRANDVIEASSLTYKRPGSGISPQFWDDVVGMRAVRDLAEDDVLTWADVTR